jgi:sulfoxide reductase heme-binding subunit YedZ
MDSDLFLWETARVAGLAAYATLAISLVTGLAMRTAVLDWLANNRGLKSLHQFTAWIWIPLGALHVSALVLDHTARIGVGDVFLPFGAPYTGSGRLGIGLGTIALDAFVIVAVTGWLKRWIQSTTWQWIHRISYLAFGLLFVHALLSGTDFSDPVVSAVTWATAFTLAVLSIARVIWGRLPAT